MIGIFYDQSKTRKHVFATQGNHERFGELLRRHADALRLEQAVETLSLTDPGAPGWIRNQLLKRLKKLKAMLLDFYHLSEQGSGHFFGQPPRNSILLHQSQTYRSRPEYAENLKTPTD